MENVTGRKVLKAEGLSIWQVRSFFSMGFLYLSYYFCKYNLGVATPGIKKEFELSYATWGLITTTVFALVYAGGQFINGFLGDRYGPKRMMIIGGLGGAAVSVCFGFSNGMLFFAIFWLLNGYFSSCGWAPGSRIMFNWFPEERWGTWMGVFNALCYTGGAIVTMVAGFAIHYFGSWRAAFFIPAACLFTMTVIFWILGKNSPQDVGLQPEWEQQEPEKPKKRTGAKEYWIAFTNRKMNLAYLSGFGANFLRWGIISWLVAILIAPTDAPNASERGFGVHIVAAGIIASFAHWGGAFFSLILGVVSDRIFKGIRWQTITIGFLISSIPLFWLAQGHEVMSKRVLFEIKVEENADSNVKETPDAMAQEQQQSEVVQITLGWVMLGVAIFISGGLIQAVQTPLFDLPGDILGKEMGGTGVGIMDGWMYVGASFAGVFLGWWLDSFGLTAGVMLMAVVSIVSGLLAIPIQK
jgi:OPA family sugar phosphate sensor protein UhpC-like MFS transporter